VPITLPIIDDRRYQDLVDESLARIPVHNPEWTNYNQSDPGVTLIEVFAFLTENLLYRANLIPDRNRLKFLTLLGVPLQPASSAEGLVQITNERGPLRTITLNSGIEVLAGKVPFRTESGLDVLPVEGQVYIKQTMATPPADTLAYYQQLYASALAPDPSTGQTPTPLLYQSVPLVSPDDSGIALQSTTVDGAFWIALLARPGDSDLDAVRKELAGKTLNLGIVPALADAGEVLTPGTSGQNNQGISLLTFSMPSVEADGGLAPDGQPRYFTLDASSQDDVLNSPGVVQIELPAAAPDINVWNDVDPLQDGLDQFPPLLQDTQLAQRLITWIRVQPAGSANASIIWTGINTVFATQRTHVANEILPQGTGEPDQSVTLANTPVIDGSVVLQVTALGQTTVWQEIDDLMGAGPEVPTPDLRLPPGAPSPVAPPVNVFTLDGEAGVITFGDGLHGKRPPSGSILKAAYDYGAGSAGNVNAGSITTAPALPPGLKVTNPVRTWGGADSETVAEGQKQIGSYLQHRDRLVTAQDFQTITWRTPGIDLARVEVLAAFNPELAPSQPGDSPGSVTLMVIPANDIVNPLAPMPDRNFLDAICAYLDPRRLITTEVFLRPPSYTDVWVSVGFTAVAGASIAVVREAVKQAVTGFLSPLPGQPGNDNGWPLLKPVQQAELVSVVSRVSGVLLVNGILLAGDDGAGVAQIAMTGLQLPRLAGLAVGTGDPADIGSLQGTTAPPTTGARVLPIPAAPEGC
jgi:hypothetical protein